MTQSVSPVLLRIAKSRDRASYKELWQGLPIGDRRRAAAILLGDRRYVRRPAILRKVAQVLKQRPQSVTTLPVSDLANAAASVQGLEEQICGDLIRKMLVSESRDLIESFLDLIGLSHDGCKITAAKETEVSTAQIGEAATMLLRRYPPNQVVLYFLYLRAEGSELFSGLSTWLSRLDEWLIAVSAGLPSVSDDHGEQRGTRNRLSLNKTIETIASLRTDGFLLAARLRSEQERLSDGLAPADHDLSTALMAVTDRHRVLRQDVREHLLASVRDDQPDSAPSFEFDDTVSLQELESAVRHRELTTEGARRVRAENRIHLVSRLRHRTNSAFGPLEVAQRLAAILAQRLADPKVSTDDVREAINSILSGTHELSALVTLVELSSSQRLVDEVESERAFDIVEGSFGRSLAIAALRSVVVLGDVDTSNGQPDGASSEATRVAVAIPPMSLSAHIATAKKSDGTKGNLADQKGTGEIKSSPETPSVEGTSELHAQGSACDEISAIDEKAAAPDQVAPSPAQVLELSALRDAPVKIRAEQGRLSGESALDFIDVAGAATDRWDVLVPSDIEGLLLEAQVPDSARAAAAQSALAWHLLARGESGFAAHVATLSEATNAGVQWRVPAWLARSVVLALSVVDAAGGIAQAIASEFEAVDLRVLLSGNEDEVIARRLLLIAATLRPTMLSPFSGAAPILADIYHVPGQEQLRGLMQAIVSYSNTGLPLSPEVLGRVAGQADWEAQLQQNRDEASAWLNAAHAYSINYQTATAVWRRWLERGGFVETLLRPVVEGKLGDSSQERAMLENVASDPDIERLIELTSRELPGHRRGQPIQASALLRLKAALREGLSFAQRWIDLREVNPHQGKGRRFEPAVTLRREVTALYGGVLREVDAALKSCESVRQRAGLVTLRAAVDDLAAVFTAADAVSRPEPSSTRALNAPLLRLPALRLTEKWEVDEPSKRSFTSSILSSLDRSVPTVADSVVERIENNDFVSARLGIELIASSAREEPEGGLAALKESFGQSLRTAQQQTKSESQSLELQLERAVSQGVINDQDRSVLSARLASVSRALESDDDITKLNSVLREVSDSLFDHRGLAKERIIERMSREGIDSTNPEYIAIGVLLERGEILAAEDYLEIALRGERPPEEIVAEQRPLPLFLTAALELEANENISPPVLIQRIRGAGDVPGLSFAALTSEQREQVCNSLELWYQQRAERDRPNLKCMRAILELVGFEVKEIKPVVEKPRWISLSTAPLRSATECPLPQFGSQAMGTYRVLVVWAPTTPREIAQEITQNGAPGAAVLVLYLGRMSEADRRQCRSLSREWKIRFAVLDESLMLFVAAAADARLSTFFACALPFTILYPYHTTAGEVPPELFVGRKQELQALEDPNGACFVYGGRQLGKTALLRDVQRRFHSPREQRVAIYIDLKAQGIGIDQPAAALWRILEQELRRLDPSQPAQVDKADSTRGVTTLIRNWLDKDSRRHLLLLLDEADNYFEKDARPPEGGDGSQAFAVSARLKGLMEQTRRRFKVVFAGLHNVQRMTHLENHPLAHLGTPICIGPLIASGEWREAAMLITRPLSAIGFELTPALVSRILMQTNYYPSLIQRYCAELAKHVIDRGAGKFGSRASPPYEITEQQVQEAYQSQELRARIRDSFSLTLNLDPRYRTIALALAYHVFTSGSVESAGEITVAALRELSLYWWSEGFVDDSSIDTFRALVEEMVGLGILRARDGHTAFRSANVQLLMGTEREIETALASPMSPEAHRPFAPSVFRRSTVSTTGESPLRSPFTAQQETAFFAPKNGVSLIVGVPAADLNNVERFLLTLRAGTPAILLKHSSDKSDLASVHGASGDDLAGTRLIAVPEQTQWTELWIHESLQRAHRRRGRVHFTNVAFISGPRKLWEILSVRANVLQDFNMLELNFVTLRPWHEAAVRQWVEDLGKSAEAELIELLREKTGFWPELLYECADAIRDEKPAALMHRLRSSEAKGNPPEARSAAAFGLDLEAPASILSVLSAHGSLADEDWRDAVMEYAPLLAGLVPRVREWADLLGLVALGQNRAWAVNPVAARVLPALSG